MISNIRCNIIFIQWLSVASILQGVLLTKQVDPKEVDVVYVEIPNDPAPVESITPGQFSLDTWYIL